MAVIVLANSRGGTGALVLYNYGWQMFFLPYAVLAVPVATTRVPAAFRARRGDAGQPGGAARCRPRTRAPRWPPTTFPWASTGAAGVPAPAGVPAEAAGAPPAEAAGVPPGPGAAAPAGPGAETAAHRFDAVAATSTRAATLVSFLGAAVLAGAAAPAARVFVHPASARELTFTFVAFAPGLVGYGLVANLSRVLLAGGRSRSAAVTTVAGWLAVLVADLAVVPLVPQRWVVPALGLGNTIGLTVAGAALLAAVVRARGRACLGGLPRASAAGLAAAVAGGAAGRFSPRR